MTIHRELMAASVEPLVLSLLNQNESYGYELMKKIAVVSSGKIEWAEGMLYPVLHRLEKAGFIQSSWKTSENGRKRKYYSIAKNGKKRLKEQKENFVTTYETLLKLSS